MKSIYFTISESSQVTSQFCELARGSWKFHRGLAFYLILDFLGYSKILLEKKKGVINLLTLTYLDLIVFILLLYSIIFTCGEKSDEEQ